MAEIRRQPELLIKTKRRAFEPVWTVLYAILLVVLAILAARLYVASRYLIVPVDGHSMEQTIPDKSVLYATRNMASVERGDIVVIDVTDVGCFSSLPADKSGKRYLIKRLIAVGGDRIKCEGGVVYLDSGEGYRALGEEYLNDFRDEEGYRTSDFGEVVLKEDEIFVMGDHRGHSDDSRLLAKQGDAPLKASMLTGLVLEWSIPGSDIDGGAEQFFVEGFINGFFR